MSINIKYYPEDNVRDHGTLGIKLPMNSDKRPGNDNIFNMSRTTEEQAVSNYINLLLTKSGERYMQPRFGIGLQYRLFENNTDDLKELILYDIQTQTKYWLPYIIHKSITIGNGDDIPTLANEGEHALHIIITFSVTEVGANKTLTIFKRGGSIDVEVT